MLKIDAHQHFWKFDPVRDSWINADMKLIRRDFFPADLQPVLRANGIDGTVVVQSDQSEAENSFQLKNAAEYDFIKGVVGWVDLQAYNIEERIRAYESVEKLKGFRHVLQGEAQRDLMLQPAFTNGMLALQNSRFTYDILVLPDQLKFVPQWVASFPNQKFVIDHLAKPDIKSQKIEQWKKDMKAISSFENVWCKISGMVTEADWKNWKYEDFVPYLDLTVELFGTKRIMYGSDWPVCLLAGSYEKMMSIVKQYFSTFTTYEQDLFFGGNATAFYQL